MREGGGTHVWATCTRMCSVQHHCRRSPAWALPSHSPPYTLYIVQLHNAALQPLFSTPRSPLHFPLYNVFLTSILTHIMYVQLRSAAQQPLFFTPHFRFSCIMSMQHIPLYYACVVFSARALHTPSFTCGAAAQRGAAAPVLHTPHNIRERLSCNKGVCACVWACVEACARVCVCMPTAYDKGFPATEVCT